MKFNKNALDKILTGIKIICAVFLILLVSMLAIQRFYTFVLPMKKGLDRNLKWDCTNMRIV